MNVTKPCPICNNPNNCSCRGSLLSFFSLLQTASNRQVLSEKPSSNILQPSLATAGIDKLNGYFGEPILKEVILAAVVGNNFSTKRIFLKDKRLYLEVIDNNQHSIHLRLGYGELDVTNFISNPNKFKSWESYWTFLTSVIPLDFIRKAQVSRLDLNLDFNCDFNDLISKIDVKGKRKAISFQDESGIRTGLTIGKDPETIVIYDKSRKEKISYPLTRIELRLSKEKLPTRSLEKLPLVLTNGSFFKNVFGFNISYTQSLKSEFQLHKLSDFKSICMRDGFYAAKKALNVERNFDRDFAKLIQIEEWNKQPTELFRQCKKAHPLKGFQQDI